MHPYCRDKLLRRPLAPQTRHQSFILPTKYVLAGPYWTKADISLCIVIGEYFKLAEVLRIGWAGLTQRAWAETGTN